MQLTLYERRVIQESLDRGYSLKKIAKTLGRSPSTISREIRHNRTPRPPKGRLGGCAERSICVRSGVCGDSCARPGESCAHRKLADCRMRCATFRKSGKRCNKLDGFPHVCNGCRYLSAAPCAIASAMSLARLTRQQRIAEANPGAASI
ncbi:helix-turn-helix domain-containing protein [Adlercreutzia murintestinalis]|uniref:helix-turn-helix domain-containing protein n=1 Tax=Adlercreutzia murintestinalis TaxID=2941325 RepID=UPI003D812123